MIPLFALRNIAAVNFYLYAQDFPLSGHGNAVFLGANGSGKSVLLDAIQIVMTGMNRRYLDLNSRVSEGGRSTRTVREACLGLLDDGGGFERNECLTYLALGFEALDSSRKCTAGVCLEAKVSVDEENVLGFFIVEDHILTFKDFVHTRPNGFEEKAWQSFLEEQRRKGIAVQTYQRQNSRAFLRELYAIINANARGTQLDPDRARAAMRQALSFDIEDIKSVTDFVKRFLLDEIPIEIDTFQARYQTWREMQTQIARVEAEIKTVESIRTLVERVLENQFNARMWSYGVQRAEYDRYAEVITRQRREIAEMQESLESTRSYQTTLTDNIETARRRLDALEQQVEGTKPAAQLRSAESQKERQDAIRRTGSVEAKPVFDALTALREAIGSPVFPSAAFPALSSFAKSRLGADPIGLYGPGWPKAPGALKELIGALPSLSASEKHIETLYQGAVAENAKLAQEISEIERLLRNVREGGAMMSKDAQDFLNDLRRMGTTAQTLSEVADIAPGFEPWRGIIESILGTWVDAIIVDPSRMDKTYDHFDRHYKQTSVKLVQTENMSVPEQAARPGTLAEAVLTDDKHARAFLNVRLGRITRAASAQDIRKGDLAASEDGKYAHGRGIEYRRLNHIPRLGKSVRDRQVAQLTSQLSVLRQKLTPAKEQEARLLAALQSVRQADDILVKNNANVIGLLEKIENADTESKRQAELIADLEAQMPQGIREEIRETEELLSAYRKEQREEKDKEVGLIDRIGQRRGAMGLNEEARNKAATLAQEAFPDFARRRRRHDPPVGLEHFLLRARTNYRNELTAQGHTAHVRNRFEALLKEKKTSHGSAVTRLATAVQDYVQGNPDQHPGFEWTKNVEEERTELYDWITLRHRHLTETVLRNFKTQVDKAVVALVETMVHDFLSRLRANIESVDRTKDDLNKALRGSIFMGEAYQIRQERDQDKETIRYLIDRLDSIAPKATALMQSKLDPNDSDQVKIKELVDMLTFENKDDTAHRRRLHELADYRNYFRFIIDICDPQHNYRRISDLEQRRGKASGGQKFVPFYICLGVAAASAYHNHLGGSKDAPPQSALLLMDEAFEKLDPDNIYKIIQFYGRLGLQLVMAAPKTHQALYQETFDTLISIIRSGRAIQATAQHFHPPARELLRGENPMHKPRNFFEEQARWERSDAAE